jgi:hypothetical protein
VQSKGKYQSTREEKSLLIFDNIHLVEKDVNSPLTSLNFLHSFSDSLSEIPSSIAILSWNTDVEKLPCYNDFDCKLFLTNRWDSNGFISDSVDFKEVLNDGNTVNIKGSNELEYNSHTNAAALIGRINHFIIQPNNFDTDLQSENLKNTSTVDYAYSKGSRNTFQCSNLRSTLKLEKKSNWDNNIIVLIPIIIVVLSYCALKLCLLIQKKFNRSKVSFSDEISNILEFDHSLPPSRISDPYSLIDEGSIDFESSHCIFKDENDKNDDSNKTSEMNLFRSGSPHPLHLKYSNDLNNFSYIDKMIIDEAELEDDIFFNSPASTGYSSTDVLSVNEAIDRLISLPLSPILECKKSMEDSNDSNDNTNAILSSDFSSIKTSSDVSKENNLSKISRYIIYLLVC